MVNSGSAPCGSGPHIKEAIQETVEIPHRRRGVPTRVRHLAAEAGKALAEGLGDLAVLVAVGVVLLAIAIRVFRHRD